MKDNIQYFCYMHITMCKFHSVQVIVNTIFIGDLNIDLVISIHLKEKHLE